jgi:phosphate acetyltransferase
MLKDSDIGNIVAIGPAGHPPCSKYERLIAEAKQVRAPTTVVVHPCEETALRGPIEAAEAGIIVPILVGPAACRRRARASSRYQPLRDRRRAA